MFSEILRLKDRRIVTGHDLLDRLRSRVVITSIYANANLSKTYELNERKKSPLKSTPIDVAKILYITEISGKTKQLCESFDSNGRPK